MKTAMSQKKITLEGINSRLDIVDAKTREAKDRAIENIQKET